MAVGRQVMVLLDPRCRFGQPLLDGTQQLLQRDRLFEKRHRAVFGRFDGGVDGAVSAHHDDRHRQAGGGAPFFQQGDAIDIGHPDVEQDEVGPHALAQRARLGGVFSHFDGVALVGQDFRQQCADAKFVVNYKNGGHEPSMRRCLGNGCRGIRNAGMGRQLRK